MNRVLDGDRNLRTVNPGSGDRGNGEGVGAALGVGRGAAAPRGAACRRGVSTAAGGGKSCQGKDGCEQPCPAAAAREREQKHAGQRGAGARGVPGRLAGWMSREGTKAGRGQLRGGGLGGLDDERGGNAGGGGDVDRCDRE